MLRIATLLFAGIALVSAGEKPRNNSIVPKGAVELSPGLFRYTDGAGKIWLYRNTPFGYVKSAENSDKSRTKAAVAATADSAGAETESPFGPSKAAAPRPVVPEQPGLTTVKEDGDVLRFERKSPFGSYKWTRKKTELTSAEQAIWERSRKDDETAAGSK